MVCLNTNSENIKITHFVYVPTSNCIIVTARDKETNRTKVYLLFTSENRTYKRNGINQTWDEMDSLSGNRFRKLVCEAFSNRNIPRYKTNLSALN